MQMNEERPVKLLNRLDELGITRKSLADAVGVTERSVYRWLNYEKEPRLTLVQAAKMCDLLMWTAQELAESYYPDQTPTK
jgi:DNA-binding XRE family transcriptional regulator